MGTRDNSKPYSVSFPGATHRDTGQALGVGHASAGQQIPGTDQHYTNCKSFKIEFE